MFDIFLYLKVQKGIDLKSPERSVHSELLQVTGNSFTWRMAIQAKMTEGKTTKGYLINYTFTTAEAVSIEHLSPESPVTTWQPIHFCLAHSGSFSSPILLLTYLKVKISLNWVLTCFCWCYVTCYQPFPACAVDRKPDTSHLTSRQLDPPWGARQENSFPSLNSSEWCHSTALALKSLCLAGLSSEKQAYHSHLNRRKTFIPFHLCLKTPSAVWLSMHCLLSSLLLKDWQHRNAHIFQFLYGGFSFPGFLPTNKLVFFCIKWTKGI